MNDALDDILADSDDEEEEAAIVSKVLDEIGIEISGKVTKLVPNLDFFSSPPRHLCPGVLLQL